MIIMVYSAYTAGSIDAALGAPEYSYWFVRRAFWPVLERFGKPGAGVRFRTRYSMPSFWQYSRLPPLSPSSLTA